MAATKTVYQSQDPLQPRHGIVTLFGRLLTLGTADLKGALGIGFDDGAWIGSAFNIALMFIGPFTVYLGGLLGARRVLILAAASFTLLCVFLPFIHNYRLLISALLLAGLSSGTFYPLTLTFALRSIPLRFLPFTLASTPLSSTAPSTSLLPSTVSSVVPFVRAPLLR